MTIFWSIHRVEPYGCINHVNDTVLYLTTRNQLWLSGFSKFKQHQFQKYSDNNNNTTTDLKSQILITMKPVAFCDTVLYRISYKVSL